MQPTIASPSSVDMSADFFHVCDEIYNPGDIQTMGRYGKTVFSASEEEIEADPLGEHLRERIRGEHFPHKPSRFKSCFVFESIDDAVWFRQFTGRKGAIYKVHFVDPTAVPHRVCYTAFRVPTSAMEGSPESAAQEFWSNPSNYDTRSEVFAESDIKVIVQCAPPL